AGVMALSVLPGSWALGAVYSLAFITGMVLPLFVIAMFIDRTKALERFQSLKRRVHYTLFGHKISLFLSHLVSGVLYIGVGSLILFFGSRGPEALNNAYQLDINLWTADATRAVSKVTDYVPETAWMIIFVSIFASIAWFAFRQARHEANENNTKEKES
ncbi:MAG: hypothetical protein ACMG55_10285, partial [Microcoleus sp.]